MTEETKFMFSAPWWVSANKEEQCYDIYNSLNDRIMSDIENEEEAKCIIYFPELYDALKEATMRSCYDRSIIHDSCKFCDSAECECKTRDWYELLEKVESLIGDK